MLLSIRTKNRQQAALTPLHNILESHGSLFGSKNDRESLDSSTHCFAKFFMGQKLCGSRVDLGLTAGKLIVIGSQRRGSELSEQVCRQTSLILIGKLAGIMNDLGQRFHVLTVVTFGAGVKFEAR
jgi:hypothetical protein